MKSDEILNPMSGEIRVRTWGPPAVTGYGANHAGQWLPTQQDPRGIPPVSDGVATEITFVDVLNGGAREYVMWLGEGTYNFQGRADDSVTFSYSVDGTRAGMTAFINDFWNTSANYSGSLTIPTGEFYLLQIRISDQDRGIQTSTVNEGGEPFDPMPAIVCFTRGTMIMTIDGEASVESLKVGDRVFTMDAGFLPIRWIGFSRVPAWKLSANPNLRPIRIRAGALGPESPTRDLLISPQHRVLVRSKIAKRMFGTDEVLIPAKKLLSLDGVDIHNDGEAVEYWHFLFDSHQIVLSNGAPTESLFLGAEAIKALSPEAKEEIAALFPKSLDASFEPVPIRLVPKKGKHMAKLVSRMALRRCGRVPTPASGGR